MTILLVSCLLINGLVFTGESSNNKLNNTESYIESIKIEVQTDKTEAVKKVANGSLDFFLYGLKGKDYESLDEDLKNETGKWKGEVGYNNIFFNPAHTVSPYECEIEGELEFNPFSIEKIRYATNFLINRKRVVEDFYNGHAESRYLPFSQSSPVYEKHYKQIVEKKGFTADGDKQKGKDMIQEGMYSAMNDTSMKGNLIKGNDGYWEYKPPNGSFSDIEIDGFTRIEDEREQIGDYFSNLLNDCGFKVDNHKWGMRSWGAVIWSSDPADLGWHFYTGGWLSDRAKYYEEIIPGQMYAGWYGYMPGGFTPSADYRYGYHEDGSSWDTEGEHGEFYGNKTLERITKRLYDGRVNSEKQYWDYMRKAVELGTEEAVRVYICSSFDYYIYNDSKVKRATTNLISGWDDIFTPRTIDITGSELEAEWYSPDGVMFCDNWNEIGISSTSELLHKKLMLQDLGVIYHPKNGRPIPIRCNWYKENNWFKKDEPKSMVKRDYSWMKNETGSLVLDRHIHVPKDAVIYDSLNDTWEEVGPGVKSAVKVTYKVIGGKWHSGANLTLSDIMGWHAWSWDMSFKDGEEDNFYHKGFAEDKKDWFNSIIGERWDKENQTYTIWGDYTFPADSVIGHHYSIWPTVPYYQYQATQFLINQNVYYAPDDVETYGWERLKENCVNWLSEKQGKNITDTMKNMIDQNYVPWYMREENNAPIPVSHNELNTEMQALIDFYDKHEHVFVSNGPFMMDSVNEKDGYVNITRFGQNDGYPFSKDYFTEMLKINKLKIESMESPEVVEEELNIDVSVKCEIIEDYPNGTARDLTEDDNFTVELELINETGETVANITPVLTDGFFTGTFDISELKPGVYTIKFSGTLPEMTCSVSKSKEVIVEPSIGPNININDFQINPLTVITGESVNITATAHCNDYPDKIKILVEDEVINSYNISSGEEIDIDEQYTFDSTGEYTIRIGVPNPNYKKTVRVIEPIIIENFKLSSEEIAKGETLDLTAEITNNDDKERTVDIKIDGETASTLTTEPGTHNYVHEIDFKETGTFKVSLGDKDAEINIVEAIIIENAGVGKKEVDKDKEIKITAQITNNDDVGRDIAVKVDGETVGFINVEPGKKTYSYEYKFDKKGTYEIIVGDESAGKISVSSDNKNDSRWISGFQISILLISISFITLLYHIKKKKRV